MVLNRPLKVLERNSKGNSKRATPRNSKRNLKGNSKRATPRNSTGNSKGNTKGGSMMLQGLGTAPAPASARGQHKNSL